MNRAASLQGYRFWCSRLQHKGETTVYWAFSGKPKPYQLEQAARVSSMVAYSGIHAYYTADCSIIGKHNQNIEVKFSALAWPYHAGGNPDLQGVDSRHIETTTLSDTGN